ncbi:LPS translocon maturation chaperone LptM [Hydrogenophaga sp.]|uniref:LPS translocon maturation chaperone LptM n=1 Tax=Hydrogenophaga sp. TaxID=1904254 RepID=UPI003D13D547
MFGSESILGRAARPLRDMAFGSMVVLMLCACGQRGNLYLPPPPDAAGKSADTPARPAPAAPKQR